ncbi:MAG: carboxypeptidase regulatory-like domain-containing protein [Deltaproteobacteria bacterium]|nr:carboxypeptidase regulatory-like domain-containing protein [Deltaproteobacteria bacterium]
MTRPSAGALPSWLLLAAALLAGCSEDTQFFAEDNGEIADELGSGFLRLDVFPSNLDADLLPQTVILEENWEGLEIEMSTPVQVNGRITGFDATPHVTATVPGEDVPVRALIAAWVPGTVMTGGTLSAEDGSYAIRLAPAAAYTFSVIPTEPPDLPFVVDFPVDVGAGSAGGAVYLDYGVPVHGRVLTEDGLPLQGIEVQAVEASSGVGGPILTTDAAGWYHLRVLPGEYEIGVSGLEGSYVPTCRVPVYAEPTTGAEQDFVFGTLEPVTVEGDIRASKPGMGVDDIEVRFTATTLADHPSCGLDVATNTDQYGHFSIRILPGNYVMEVVPPYPVALSPLQESVEIGDESALDLGEIDLEGFVPISAVVRGPGEAGEPVEGVQVHVEVIGFDGFTYDTFTDKIGAFEMDVPHAKLSVRLTPPSTDLAVRRIDVPVDDFPEQVVLGSGRRIAGTVAYRGEPVAYTPIEVRDRTGRLYATTTTGEAGAFAVRVEQE